MFPQTPEADGRQAILGIEGRRPVNATMATLL
jgi:hypothetical protein